MQQHEGVSRWIKGKFQDGETLAISCVTVAELTCFPKLSEKERRQIEAWISQALVLDVTRGIAERAGRLGFEYGIKTVDALIAATAAHFHIPLATYDTAFRKIKEINVIAP